MSDDMSTEDQARSILAKEKLGLTGLGAVAPTVVDKAAPSAMDYVSSLFAAGADPIAPVSAAPEESFLSKMAGKASGAWDKFVNPTAITEGWEGLSAGASVAKGLGGAAAGLGVVAGSIQAGEGLSEIADGKVADGATDAVAGGLGAAGGIAMLAGSTAAAPLAALGMVAGLEASGNHSKEWGLGADGKPQTGFDVAGNKLAAQEAAGATGLTYAADAVVDYGGAALKNLQYGATDMASSIGNGVSKAASGAWNWLTGGSSDQQAAAAQ